MKTYLQRGFTLIELLVVIAIIGILSSVVLASLNTARTKGADSAVKADFRSLRAQAELWYDNNGNKYNTTGAATNTCAAASTIFADTTITNMIAHITANVSSGPSCYTNATGANWAVGVTLKGGTTWCVDSTGWVKAGTAAAAGTCS